ncbi:MAG: tRNA epoxyqueuosine(34) reductase QueG [Ignavibacteria bacterium]|nr:tRNA epoxyqueuosine(34) reductase QueG [Ignavibacteria bacterium]
MSDEKSIRTSELRQKLFGLGFDLVGFTKAAALTFEASNLRTWLDNKFDAEMKWIEKRFEGRINPKKVLPEAESIISLGLNYYQVGEPSKLKNYGKVSRYAWGKDYHKVFEKKFKSVNKILFEIDARSKNKFYVDYGPTMDKVWAVRSGLGWMGKHTNVISTSIGSWFFIGTVLTSIELNHDSPILDLCGECDLCMLHCPTEAIIKPYVLDSNRCISYQTIENQKVIPVELAGKFENFIFGCDICQDVCPWNIKLQTETCETEFASNTIKELSFDELDESSFKTKFKHSPIRRAGLKALKRNFKFLKS